MSGCEVRSSDSVHPVHSWKWSQITEGLTPAAAASATRAAAAALRPTAAAAMVTALTKLRRSSSPPSGTRLVSGLE